MKKGLKTLAAIALFLGWSPAAAQKQREAPSPPYASADWSPDPWLADLAQMRRALETKYANLQWLLTEREFDLNGLFERAANVLRQSRNDADAKILLNRVVERIDDGHVSLSWPLAVPASPHAGTAPQPLPLPTAAAFCRAQGYHPGIGGAGIGPSLPGYRPIATGDLLPAGTVQAGPIRTGIVRIGVFDPHGSSSLCEEAVAALAIPLDRHCDEACKDSIITDAYRRLTGAFEDRLIGLRAAGAEVVVVDIAGNGGGSEWAEVAARMLSRRPLTSARMGFVRGQHWERLWREQAERLRGFAATASAQDRPRLLTWASEAEAARAEAARHCPPTGDRACPWLGRAGFSTGLAVREKTGAGMFR